MKLRPNAFHWVFSPKGAVARRRRLCGGGGGRGCTAPPFRGFGGPVSGPPRSNRLSATTNRGKTPDTVPGLRGRGGAPSPPTRPRDPPAAPRLAGGRRTPFRPRAISHLRRPPTHNRSSGFLFHEQQMKKKNNNISCSSSSCSSLGPAAPNPADFLVGLGPPKVPCVPRATDPNRKNPQSLRASIRCPLPPAGPPWSGGAGPLKDAWHAVRRCPWHLGASGRSALPLPNRKPPS